MKQRFELIEKYIDGSLTSEESNSLEQLITSDSAFSKEYQLRLEVNKAIMEKNIMKFRDNLNMIYNEHRSLPGVVRLLFVRNWHLVSASVAILVIIGGFLISRLNNSSADRIFDKYYSSENAIYMTRSSELVVDAELSIALEKFQNNEYGEAINLLAMLEDNVVAQYYLGLSYMETDQFTEAKESFQFILDQSNNLFIEQAKWYQALCLLKLDNKEAATELFTSILNDDSLYNENATDILRRLK